MSGQTELDEMAQVRQLSTIMYAQEFFTTVRDKCFNKCIQTPGRSLSSTEQTCLQRCVDRYAEVTELVTQTFLSDDVH